MFGIYPAGDQWVRRIASDRAAQDIQSLLTEKAGFKSHHQHEPFGVNRGRVLASHQGFLVMVEKSVSDVELLVVPDLEIQRLLWAFNHGYSQQWSDRELKILTGQSSWPDLLEDVSRRFKWTYSLVEQAVAGTLVAQKAVVTEADGAVEIDDYDPDTLIPVDQFGFEGGDSCVL